MVRKKATRKRKTYRGKSLRPGGGGRFARLKGKLKRKGVRKPGALAAHIGRKKYGKRKFQKMASRGRKRATRRRRK
jgi:hypothetical protein